MSTEQETLDEMEQSIAGINSTLEKLQTHIRELPLIPETPLLEKTTKTEDSGKGEQPLAMEEELLHLRTAVRTLAGYGEHIRTLQKNMATLTDFIQQFKKVMVERSNKQTLTMERYRILSHLGEMDSKVLALLFNGVPFENDFLEEISELRRIILSDENVKVEEIQKRFNRIFKEFADIFENSAKNLSHYQKETKKIIQNMRDVIWM